MLAEFKKTMQKYKICPLFLNHIYRVIQQFCGGYGISEIKLPRPESRNKIFKGMIVALDEQEKKLGIGNMMFGVISTRFRECRALYYKKKSFGRNYTATQWGKWFIRSLLELSLKLWTNRCDILHEEKKGTMEGRLRSLAEKWLIQLRANPTMIPTASRFLLNRSPTYFQKGDIRSVTAWVGRMENELREAKIERNTSDIRRWLNLPNQNENKNTVRTECAIESNFSSDTNIQILNRFDNDSQNATCDFLMEDDSITTFPDYTSNDESCTKKVNMQPIPKEIPLLLQQDRQHLSEVQQCESKNNEVSDIYEMVSIHKHHTRKILYDTDNDDVADPGPEIVR